MSKLFEVAIKIAYGHTQYGHTVFPSLESKSCDSALNGLQEGKNESVFSKQVLTHPFVKNERFAAYFKGMSPNNRNEHPLPNENTHQETQKNLENRLEPTLRPKFQPSSAPTLTIR